MTSPGDSLALRRDGDRYQPPIVRAARSPSVAAAAYRYAALGFSVLPLSGKIPVIRWEIYQDTRATVGEIEAWERSGLLDGNVGLVCGRVSGGLVVLDLDGELAYEAFRTSFSRLADTYTVATGSGRGYHLCYQVDVVPLPSLALVTPLGNLELRSSRLQVVAPPSLHPETGQPYQVHHPVGLKHVKTLADVANWIDDLASSRRAGKAARGPISIPAVRSRSSPPTGPTGDKLPPHLIQAVADHFRQRGYRARGEWLNGPCIYPERHAHHDAKSSFGFNTRSGYGYCFVCGSMLAKEIARKLHIV